MTPEKMIKIVEKNKDKGLYACCYIGCLDCPLYDEKYFETRCYYYNKPHETLIKELKNMNKKGWIIVTSDIDWTNTELVDKGYKSLEYTGNEYCYIRACNNGRLMAGTRPCKKKFEDNHQVFDVRDIPDYKQPEKLIDIPCKKMSLSSLKQLIKEHEGE